MIDIGTIITGLLTGGLYALIALGLALVFGVMRLVNLAHGEFLVLGGYLASIVVVALGWDPLVSLILVIPIVFALGYPVQRLLLTRLLVRGIEQPLVATFGISLVISATLVLAFGANAKDLPAPYATTGIPLLGTIVRVSDVITFVIAVVLVVGTHLVLTRTRFGSSLRAAAADPATAGTMGIDVPHVYALTFAAAASLAAVAGVLVGIGFSLTPASGTAYVLIGFTVVVLGGTGNVLGTLAGGLALGLIQAIGSRILGGQYRDLVIYVAFLVILLIKPFVQRMRDTLAVRRASLQELEA